MSNGHRPERPDTTRIDPRVLKRMRETNTLGLLDTLVAISGMPRSLDTLSAAAASLGTMGAHHTGAIRINPNLESKKFVETLAHEMGHLAGYSTETGAWGAVPFTRAVLALRATRPDTTGAEQVIGQFQYGIHPLLSDVENRRGEQPETGEILRKLLSLPIYKKHPLYSRRKDIGR